MIHLDEIVRRSLSSFAADALNASWTGRREREAVSLYVFGHLLQQVNASGFLRDPTQIGVEFPVPQIDSNTGTAISGRRGTKRQVCKDVVIWPQPRMTCWDEDGNPTVAPAAIIEWKFSSATVHAPDVTWLEAFSSAHPSFIGYALTANPPGSVFRLSCTCVTGGRAQPEWLHIP